MRHIHHFFAFLLMVAFTVSCKEQQRQETEEEIKQSYKIQNIPYCKKPFQLSKEDKQSIDWYVSLDSVNKKGYTDIPIKQGKFKLRIPNHTIAAVVEVCDYHDNKGYQLEEIVFSFKILPTGQFMTKTTDSPEHLGYIPDLGVRGIHMYNLSKNIEIDDQQAAERLKIMGDKTRYEPAYLMNYYPLIYYPNINYDNYKKKFNGEYYPKYFPTAVGIKGVTDDATGKPMLISCSIYRFDLIKDDYGNEIVDRTSMLNSNLTSENSHGDGRLGSTCKGYPQYIKKYEHFFVFQMDLNDYGARNLDKIAKYSYQTLKSYILPINSI